jgi:hypothetical protein
MQRRIAMKDPMGRKAQLAKGWQSTKNLLY